MIDMKKVTEWALGFAMRALDGRWRKIESDKPDVIHAMTTGAILKSHGFDDGVVIAGYWHDLPEDTNLTIDDLKKLLSAQELKAAEVGRIIGLIMTAYNPPSTDQDTDVDPRELWFRSKKQKIKHSKYLRLENRAVILADKIASLREDRLHFQKQGYIDYSALNAEFKPQKWYNEEMYQTLAEDMEQFYDDPRYNNYCDMLEEYRQNILCVFHGQSSPIFMPEVMDNSLKKEKITAQREELQQLISLIESPKPFIIEFAGAKETGEPFLMNIIKDFFNNDGFQVKVISSETESKSLNNVQDSNGISEVESRLLIAAEIKARLLSNAANGHNVIMVERGLFDNLLWLKRRLNKSEAVLNSYITDFEPELANLINYVVITCDKPLMMIEPEYEEALQACQTLLKGNSLLVSPNILNHKDTSLETLSHLLAMMRTDYVQQLKKFIDSKKIIKENNS